jgi:hypothetical protein
VASEGWVLSHRCHVSLGRLARPFSFGPTRCSAPRAQHVAAGTPHRANRQDSRSRVFVCVCVPCVIKYRKTSRDTLPEHSTLNMAQRMLDWTKDEGIT